MATKQIDPLPSTVKVGRKLYNVHTVDKMHKRGDMGRVVYDSKHIEIALRSSAGKAAIEQVNKQLKALGG